MVAFDPETARPGDHIQIDGHEFKIGSKTVRVEDDAVTSFHVMANEHDPLTDKTISRLYVDRQPFELAVCNGTTHEIAPEDIEQ